jgi:hypothetical protein
VRIKRNVHRRTLFLLGSHALLFGSLFTRLIRDVLARREINTSLRELLERFRHRLSFLDYFVTHVPAPRLLLDEHILDCLRVGVEVESTAADALLDGQRRSRRAGVDGVVDLEVAFLNLLRRRAARRAPVAGSQFRDVFVSFLLRVTRVFAVRKLGFEVASTIPRGRVRDAFF